MDEDKEIISKLKFIGKLEKGEKINVKHMFVQPEGILTSISRTIINRSNRKETIEFISKTIEKSVKIIQLFSLHNEPNPTVQIRQNIIEDLDRAKRGLINLKDTYNDDVKFCCDIDTILEQVDAYLTKLNVKTFDVNKIKRDSLE